MDIIKKISQQTFWQILGKGVSTFSTLIVLGFITRSYGETGTGIFTLATTYLAFFFLAADLGLNGYVLPRLDNNENEADKLFSARLIWSLFLLILANLLVKIMPFNSPLFEQSVFFGSLTITATGIFATTNLIFQKKLRFDRSIIASAVGSFLLIPTVLLLIYLKLPASYLILGTLAGWIGNNVLALILVNKLHKFKFIFPDVSYPLSVFKKAWPISVTLLLNIAYFRLDAFILSSTRSLVEVGVYNLAYQVFQTALVLPTFIMNGYYPLMLQLLQTDKGKFLMQVKIAAGILLAISLTGTILTWLLAPTVINILSGNAFGGSARSLQILSLSFPAFFLTSLLMWIFMALKKYQPMMLIYLVGLILNFVSNLIFIPQYSFIAASWITVVSEYLILGLQVGILLRGIKGLRDK